LGGFRRALGLGRAGVEHFFTLVGGRVCEPIQGPAFRDLMLAIAEKPDGNRIALEILSMRLHSDGEAKRKPLPETVEAGRTLLSQHNSDRTRTGQIMMITSSALWRGIA